MTITMNIHGADDVSVESFHPGTSCAISIAAGGIIVTYFGMPPAIAWGIFDLLRNEDTSFYWGANDIHRIGKNPEYAARVIKDARDATLLPEAV